MFSIIIVGVKNWLILKKSIFSIFYRFQTLLQKAQNENQRRTTLLRMPKKFRKRGSITFRLSNLVEEHLSYMWIYFGRLAEVCYFRIWIFAKKTPKNGSTQKYLPPFSRLRDMTPLGNPVRSHMTTRFWRLQKNLPLNPPPPRRHVFFFSGDLTGDLTPSKKWKIWWPLVTSKNALFQEIWWPLVTSLKSKQKKFIRSIPQHGQMFSFQCPISFSSYFYVSELVSDIDLVLHSLL